MEGFIAQLNDKKTALEGLEGLKGIVSGDDYCAFIKVVTDAIPDIMDATAHKEKPVATAAADLAKQIFDKVDGWSATVCLKQLEKSIEGKAKPTTQEVALEIITTFAKKFPKCVAREIEWIVHPLVFLMNAVKASVKSKAKDAMLALCATSGNKDLEAFVPVIIKANESQKNVGACVEELAGCIFVQNVEAPALSVITPVLWRGLNEKSEATQRRCCVIVDNMSKLIDDPREGAPLLPAVWPLVKKRADEISDPDAREKAEQALVQLEKLAAIAPRPELSCKDVLAKHTDVSGVPEGIFEKYLQPVSYQMCKASVFEPSEWVAVFKHFNLPAEAVGAMSAELAVAGEKNDDEFIDQDTDVPDLYKGTFSLAFGTLTLLRDAKLHLKKFKFYGLLGPNNCGKTTLMRAISREQVEGFPKRSELVTIFVEHEVEERQLEEPSKEWPLGKYNIDLNGIEFVVDTCNNVYKKSPPLTADIVEKTLGEIGFKNPHTGVNPKAAASMTNPITTYSGGWKVKMQLACAKLIEADILMLDEPTGHLDVKNIEWMKEWLNAFPGSIIATSSNSVFLDEMCTHIVDFNERKLRQFQTKRGHVLTDYVTKYPEKSSYFELSNKNQKFIFPVPGPLEGVKSRTRAVLKMTGVSFKYATHEKNTVQDICLAVCMASRIAVVGPNGAGKSTAIKLLIGELKQIDGIVYRHPGLRMAYVAQHAFHHLEKHLQKTAVQYILWRFAGNDDRESLENQTKEINIDEEALRKISWCVDPKSGSVRKCVPGDKSDKPVKPDCIMNRRKNKQKKYEYEVKWMLTSVENTCWVERDTMLSMGYEKMVCRKDEQEAAAAGLMSKPLTAPSVEKALKEFGMDAESASHNPIASLSGGQKVKVVLAAAMWQNPHILILDEPTNYLDRDGLGALSLGLKEYGGGVVIISHNMEFANSVCTQKWIMEAGRLREEGELEVEDDDLEGNNAAGAEEIVDNMGNKIVVSRAKTMTDKERKKAVKEIEKRLKEHRKKNTLSEAEVWELEDKINELKNEMGA